MWFSVQSGLCFVSAGQLESSSTLKHRWHAFRKTVISPHPNPRAELSHCVETNPKRSEVPRGWEDRPETRSCWQWPSFFCTMTSQGAGMLLAHTWAPRRALSLPGMHVVCPAHERPRTGVPRDFPPVNLLNGGNGREASGPRDFVDSIPWKITSFCIQANLVNLSPATHPMHFCSNGR